MFRSLPRMLVKIALWFPLSVCAFLWRSLMFRTSFVAVTGSFGKTATKDCLAAALAVSGNTIKTPGNSNGRGGIILTILKVRPWHRWAVIEAGTELPGNLWRASLLIRPDVVVILSVGRAHTKSLRTVENVAAEKARLLRFLRRRGIAVLNRDDPHVAAMGTKLNQRIIWFGSQAECDLQYSEVEASWPETLRFKAKWNGQTVDVRTAFHGAHRVVSVAGALAAAAALGAPLDRAAEGIRDVQPHTARLAPAPLPSGAVILRDEINGSIDSLGPALDVLRTARAKRRILIISDCSDWGLRPRERAKFLARSAKTCSDMVVFLGEKSHHGVKYALNEGMAPQSVHGFLRWQDAAVFLRSELRSGDLALLRGLSSEHLSRLYFALLGEVACDRHRCEIRRPCDNCPRLGLIPFPAPEEARTCAE
jgi:UDP-N-acetylmuramoyl-tripeptide--D-alanyl-D-alanine ligase